MKLSIRITIPIVLGAVMFALAGCGTPAIVSIPNVVREGQGNATEPASTPAKAVAALNPTEQGTKQSTAAATGAATSVATTAATVSSTISSTVAATTAVTVAATTVSTAIPTTAATAVVTSAATKGAAATDDNFVLIYQLYGTPTPTTPGKSQGSPATPAATVSASTPAAATPTTAAVTAVTAVAAIATAASTPAAAPASSAGGAGDPKKGQAIFTNAGCGGCHDIQAGVTIVGPTLKGIATRAGTRKPGMSAQDYIRESITAPNAFIVPTFPSGIMPQTFAQTLSKQQIDDLIAYLLTLK